MTDKPMTGSAAEGDFVDVENYFGGTGYAGGSLTSEAESIARNLRAATFTDDEVHLLSGRRCLRLADVLDRLVSENERLRAEVETLTAERDEARDEIAEAHVHCERNTMLAIEQAVEVRDVRIATLTDQLREARETTTAVKRNHIVEAQRLIRERDAALAELATLREQADTISPPKRRAGAILTRALPDPPKGDE